MITVQAYTVLDGLMVRLTARCGGENHPSMTRCRPWAVQGLVRVSEIEQHGLQDAFLTTLVELFRTTSTPEGAPEWQFADVDC